MSNIDYLDNLITLTNSEKAKIKFKYIVVKAGTYQTIVTKQDLGIAAHGGIHGAIATAGSIDTNVDPTIICSTENGNLLVKLYYEKNLYTVKTNFGAFIAVFYND